jgi:hypothetical protein
MNSEKVFLFGKRGKAKKNVLTARIHLFFAWTFQKGVYSHLIT